MTRSWWGKFCLLSFLIALSVVYIYPTVANLDLEKTRFPFKQKMNLGLDLQGGVYLVLGVDFNKVYKDVIERQSSSLKDRLTDKGVRVTGVSARQGPSADDPRMLLDFDPAQRQDVYSILKKEFWTLRL